MGPSWYRVVVLLFLGVSKGDLPEDEFRIVRKEELLSDSDVFEDNSTSSFSQLLFDVARDQIIVGARDVLFRLSLRGLQPLEHADWPAPADAAQLCQDKGQTEQDCHNYVKVLLSHGNKIFACGTNAFSPVCSWREVESLSSVTEWVSSVVACPHSPHSNVTAILSSAGDYFAGTPTNFASSDNAICRVGRSGTIRTEQYNLKWLNEPQFVGSFEDRVFVYFVFREVAVEFMNCGQITYSRIARVCKNDSGGRLVFKNTWRTFAKARLRCSVGRDQPFDYDEVKSVEFLSDEGLLVATFTTPDNSIPGSAVCVYNMSDITAAFDGPFKVQEAQDRTWESRQPPPPVRERFNCLQTPHAEPYESIDHDLYQLMYKPITPISNEPVFKRDGEKFTHITSDVVSTKSGKQLVLFVATQRGDIIKVAVLPRIDGACLVERWKLGEEGMAMQKMQFVKDTMSVYIGGARLLRVSGARCGRHSPAACVAAGDPHCACAARAEPTACVQLYQPVDGGWSGWGPWEPCEQAASASTEEKDMCLCRQRRCDSPAPKRGGRKCEGASVSVTNCTVHGGWTAWGPWGACSAPCGLGVRARRRACAAPAPAHAGRPCLGPDRQDVFCTLPPCPDPSLAPIDGGWSPWSSWSPCAGAGGGGGGGGGGCGAGGGLRERRRACTHPATKNGGADCEGGKVERQVCDLRPCEIRKATAWTPWVHIPGNSSDGSYVEKRFKFLCKAPSSEQIKLSIAREEDRYCTSDGACGSTPPDRGGWGAWAAWGVCSAPCGGGQQTRSRGCLRPPCVGVAEAWRACNTHACTGQWSCWTDWSACSGDCGRGALTGHRTRTRLCLSTEGCDAGAAVEKRICINDCPESETGWSEWSEWSPCETGERTRRRSCRESACRGPAVQVDTCGEIDNELKAMPAYSQGIEMASFVSTDHAMSVGGIVGLCIAAFILGGVSCVLLWRVGVSRGWGRGRGGVPASPHYITAKQNCYVTVPLRDVPRKPKRQPSFSNAGGLPAKSNNNATAPRAVAVAPPHALDNHLAHDRDKFY